MSPGIEKTLCPQCGLMTVTTGDGTCQSCWSRKEGKPRYDIAPPLTAQETAAELGGLIFKTALAAAYVGIVLALVVTHHQLLAAIAAGVGIAAAGLYAFWWQYGP